MLATVPSATLLGVDGRPVRVEVHVPPACPASPSSGCPTRRAARPATGCGPRCSSSGLAVARPAGSPSTWRPPGVRKVGAGLDLAIAVGLLVASEQLAAPRPSTARRSSASSGSTARSAPVPGRGAAGRRPRRDEVVVPPAPASEAALVGPPPGPVRAEPARELVAALRAEAPWPDPAATRSRRPRAAAARPGRRAGPAARPPGPRGRRRRRPPPAAGRPAGRRQDDARPPPARACCPTSTTPQALEATRIHSAAGAAAAPAGWCAGRRSGRRTTAPRAVALVGGGSRPLRPGRDLAGHRRRAVPRRAGRVRAGRARLRCASRSRRASSASPGPRPAVSAARPGSCWSAAMNPCPCGEGGHAGVRAGAATGRGALPPGAVGPAARPLRPPARASPGPTRDELLGGAPSASPGRGGRASGSPRPRRGRRAGCPRNADAPGGRCSRVRPALAPTPAPCSSGRCAQGRLTARGLHRVRRVALTLADLAGDEAPVARRSRRPARSSCAPTPASSAGPCGA